MPIFTKSLADLVKGIRNHKDDEAAFVSKCVAELKKELAMDDRSVKAEAVKKLTHLDTMGYDITWASFRVVEVMSQPWFGHKRVGYLAASLSFTRDTDVTLLTTHLFKKAFSQVQTSDSNAGFQYEIGCAINCVSNIVTHDLANDLLNDIYGMMNSSKPYIRKRAVLVLYPIFKQWPKALRLSFERLQQKLQDDDPAVATAAVNVICELSRKHPKNYLGIVPPLFKLLTSSGNNWMLIKVVKLLGSLVPVEPRLEKKLVEPLTQIISTTPAKSLLYECINTVTNGELSSKSTTRLCLEKLKLFVEDPDQNLKYLGLLGLHKIMKKRPREVSQHREMILQCLNDEDVTIRTRALDLITSMVSQKNLVSIVRRLCEHAEAMEGAYREHVIQRIIEICTQERYGFIADFRWFLATLINLTHLDGVSQENADLINESLMDVIIRVPEVRKFAVQQMTHMILENRLLSDRQNVAENSLCAVLYAAAWTVGEFSDLVTEHLELVSAMLQPRVASLPERVRAVFLQNAIKVFSAALTQMSRAAREDPTSALNSLQDDVVSPSSSKDSADSKENGVLVATETETTRKIPHWVKATTDMAQLITQQLELFTLSTAIEVQERAVSYQDFISWLIEEFRSAPENGHDIVDAFALFFRGELNPVHPRAQRKVQPPKGLDLDAWINEPVATDDEDDLSDGGDFSFGDGEGFAAPKKEKLTIEDLVSARKAADAAKEMRESHPFYITSKVDGESANGGGMDLAVSNEDVDDIPIATLGKGDLPAVQIISTSSSSRRSSTRGGNALASGERTPSSRFAASLNDLYSPNSPPGVAKKKYTVNTSFEGADSDEDRGDDLPRSQRGRRRRGGAARRSRDLGATVGANAPKDTAAAEDDTDDEIGKIDVTSPLDESETIPKIKPYTQPIGDVAASATASQRNGDDKKKERSRRHRKHRRRRSGDKENGRGDKDGGDDKDKDKDGGDKPSSSSRRHRHHHRRRKDGDKPSSSRRKKGDDTGDLLSEIIGAEGVTAGGGGAESVGSVSAVANLVIDDEKTGTGTSGDISLDMFDPISTPRARAPSNNAKGRNRDSSGKDDSGPMKSLANGVDSSSSRASRSSKHHRSSRHHRDRDRDRDRDHSSSSSASRKNRSSSSSSRKYNLEKKLCSDNFFRATYEARASTKLDKTIVVQLSLTVLKGLRISKLRLRVRSPSHDAGDADADAKTGGMRVQAASSSSSSSSRRSKTKVSSEPDVDGFSEVLSLSDLGSGQKRGRFEVTFDEFVGPQALTGALEYIEKTDSSPSKTSHSLDVAILIPSSSFVVPPARDKVPSVQELSENALPNCKKLSSHRIELNRFTSADVLELIPQVVNVRVVHREADKMAAYYAKTLTGDHVAVYCKKRDLQINRPEVSIDVKSSSQLLADSLLVELVTALAV